MRRAAVCVLMLAAGLVRGCVGGFTRVGAVVCGLARVGVARTAARAAVCVRAAPARALLCAGSIGRACESGLFTAAQLEYMRVSKESCDARDVVWHRAVTKAVHRLETVERAGQPWCCTEMPEIAESDWAANNEIMHALEDADGRSQTKRKNGRAKRWRGSH